MSCCHWPNFILKTQGTIDALGVHLLACLSGKPDTERNIVLKEETHPYVAYDIASCSFSDVVLFLVPGFHARFQVIGPSFAIHVLFISCSVWVVCHATKDPNEVERHRLWACHEKQAEMDWPESDGEGINGESTIFASI